ncbi:hypothetical protein HPB47_021260, partial [Ixodes persulcatus]
AGCSDAGDVGYLLRELEGHVWDIYTCRFFPSGVVVLSGGADMQLKIWSAETGKCPVTMKGHSAAIHDTCVVDQGRNVISASKDGTARLWDCGQSACLGTLAEFEHDAINCCALGSSAAIDLGCREEPSNDREVGTEGKLLVVGTEAGTLRGVGVHSRQTVFELKAASAINCCCSMGQNRFLYGTQGGDIYMLDARQPREPSLTWANSSSPALSLITHKQGFMVGRDQETFSKARLYQLDKSKFGFYAGLWNQVETTLVLILGGFPFFWSLCEQWAAKAGFSGNELVVTSFFIVVGSLISTVVDLPWSIYYTFVIEQRHGFNNQTAGFFAKDRVKKFFLMQMIIVPIVAGIVQIIKLGGDYFFIYLWFFTLVVSLLMSVVYSDFIAPLLDKFTPLPEGDLRTKIEELAASIHFPLKKLFVVE